MLQDNLSTELAQRDWGVQQVLTSANWGGVVGNFFTGGLNLQIEHHLFPAISFMHYPAIAAIVADECKKRGINVSRAAGALVPGWCCLAQLCWCHCVASHAQQSRKCLAQQLSFAQVALCLHSTL